MRVVERLLAGLVAVVLCAPALAERVLVFGGTGLLGARIVRQLVDRGDEVTVFVRPTSDRSRLDGLDVDYVTGDLTDAATVDAAFSSRSFDAVVVSVRAPLSEQGFFETAVRHLLDGAGKAGVQHIVYQGAVGAGDNMARHPDVPWTQVPGLEARMIDQGKAERLLLDSDIPVTIIRNARVYPDDTPATGHAELTEDQSVLTPNTRADLARVTVECVGDPRCFGKVYHLRDESLSWPPPGRAQPGGE